RVLAERDAGLAVGRVGIGERPGLEAELRHLDAEMAELEAAAHAVGRRLRLRLARRRLVQREGLAVAAAQLGLLASRYLECALVGQLARLDAGGAVGLQPKAVAVGI